MANPVVVKAVVPIVPIVPPVTPQAPSNLEQKLAVWGKKSSEFASQVMQNQTNIKTFTDKLNVLNKPTLPENPTFADKIQHAVEGMYVPFLDRISAQEITTQLNVATDSFEKSAFFHSLYNDIPALLSGTDMSVDEILKVLVMPKTLTSQEQSDARASIQDMVDTFSAGTAPKAAPMAKSDVVLPELVTPKPQPQLITMQRITANEIKLALMAPRVPNPIMSNTEYQKFLLDSGMVENAGDSVDLKAQSEQIVKEWQDRNSMLSAFRSGMVTMPKVNAGDYLKNATLMPGLAIAEIVNTYYEHTAQPWAGAFFKNFTPDIEAEYQRQLRAGAGQTEALQKAWASWDAPFSGAWEFILKTMIIESLFDPTTYIGWGILTKVTKPLGVAGRWVGAAERGYAEIMDAPLDALKWLNKAKIPEEFALKHPGFISTWGTDIIPKTSGQMAAAVQHRSVAAVRSAVEKWSIAKGVPKTILQITKDDMRKFIPEAIDYALTHPASEQYMAEAGRELLSHKMITPEEISKWSGATKGALGAGDISKEKILVINDLFDEFLYNANKVPTDAFASRLLSVLESVDDPKLASKILESRVKSVKLAALSLAEMPNGGAAMMRLGERNFDIHVDISNSKAVIARQEMGRVTGLFTDTGVQVQKVWANTIDRVVIKPFSEAYLVFGLYGPMNILEDMWRSTLGGVFPHRYSASHFAQLGIGLKYDPDLMRGVYTIFGKETLAGSRRNNWILTLGMLPLSLPTFGISAAGELLGKKTVITPARFARGAYENLVYNPGALGMDFRRNFIGRKFRNFLAEMGGTQAKMLMDVVEEFTGSNKNLNKQVTQYVTDMALTADPEQIRAGLKLFTHKRIVHAEIEKLIHLYPEMPRSVQQYILDKFDSGEMFAQVKGATTRDAKGRFMAQAGSIETTFKGASDNLYTEFLHTPQFAQENLADLSKVLKELDVKNPQEMAQVLQGIQLAHKVYGSTPGQIIAEASSRSRGMNFDTRNSVIGKALDDIADFRAKSTAELDSLVLRAREQLTKSGNTPAYMDSANHLFDIQSARRLKLDALNADMDVWRRGYFAGATKENLKSSSWWDTFYNELDGHVAGINNVTSQFDSQIDQLAQGMSGGARVRPPVMVQGAVTPNDVAQLIGINGDALSRAILDNLSFINNREMFTNYVMGYVKDIDKGFSREGIGKVFDQIVTELTGSDNAVTWLTAKKLQLEGLRKDVHTLYGKKLVPPKELKAMQDYITKMADKVDGIVNVKDATGKVIRKAEFAKTPQTGDEIAKALGVKFDGVQTGTGGIKDKFQFTDSVTGSTTYANNLHEAWSNINNMRSKFGKDALPKPIKVYDDIRQEAMDEAHKWYYKEYVDYSHGNVVDAMMKTVYPYWSYECVDISTQILTRKGWKLYNELIVNEDVLVTDPKTLVTRWEHLQEVITYDYDDKLMVIPAKGKDIKFTPNHRWLVIDKFGKYTPKIKEGQYLIDGYDCIPRALPHEFPTDSVLSKRDAQILGWACTDGYINRTQSRKPRLVIYQSLDKYLIEVQELTGSKGHYRKPTGYSRDDGKDFVIFVKQADADRILSICSDWSYLPELVGKLDKPSAYAMWDAMFKAEGNIFISPTGKENNSWTQNPGPVMQAFQILSILVGKAITVKDTRVNILNNRKPYLAKETRRLRTEHYKGKIWCPVTPSGTWFANFNGCILPTGNSQRWQWLAHSFLQHPSTLAALGRWNGHTEQGYEHIPGTNIDIRPGAGTVYAPLVGRLMKQDYPEYYDSLPMGKELVQFNDFLSRYGFYPGAHLNIPLAVLGGQTPQYGELIPSTPKSLLDIIVGLNPKSEAVKSISKLLFNDRFKDYLTTREVTKRGGNGVIIQAKIHDKVALTEEEQSIWDESRGYISLYSALFSQVGMLRLRPQEMIEIKAASTKAIQEMFGFTSDQQDWLYAHGYKLTDMVGGLSKSEQAVLEGLGYYKYAGSSTPLLPGKQQDIVDRIQLDWDTVRKYSDNKMQSKLSLQNNFLSGAVSAKDYAGQMTGIYTDLHTYIENKVNENPLMDLDNRAEYYKQFNLPQPTLHPMDELLNMYFAIELKEIKDPETGEITKDWDTFFAERDAVTSSIPDNFKQEWDDVITKNSTYMENIHREVSNKYFRKYNQLFDTIMERFKPEEQAIIKEFMYYDKMGSGLDRQNEIMAQTDAVSRFKSDLSNSRKALRYANPHLDAWLYYWGRVGSFATPQAEAVYRQIAQQTGRKL